MLAYTVSGPALKKAKAKTPGHSQIILCIIFARIKCNRPVTLF
jgi:hypothetical protein